MTEPAAPRTPSASGTLLSTAQIAALIPHRWPFLLVEQVTGLVRWRESVAAMAEAGVDHFVEFGGKVLAPMVKRIAPDARTTSVVTMADLDALAKEI